MIVKNESKIIKECLENVVPYVDSICITDTGSSDDTIEIMKTFLQTQVKKPSKICRDAFVDFGTTRTKSLRNAEEFLKDNSSTWNIPIQDSYLLVMDADDKFHASPNFSWNQVFRNKENVSSVKFQFVRGSSIFARTQLFKADITWSYIGVLHEYCYSEKDTFTMSVSKDLCQFDANTLGCRSQDPQKQQKDALLLQKALLDEPDNERQVFYLAQSYRDSLQNDLAIKYYLKRWSMKRWCEELFQSAFQLTLLLKSSEWAWRSLEACPDRAEAILAYMCHCRATNQWSQEVQAMAFYAWKNFHGRIPKDRLLFVDTEAYSWKILDEFSIIAWQTGHPTESRQALLQLLSENKFPQIHKERLVNNFSFFNQSPQDPK